jgi:hypothetical protein
LEELQKKINFKMENTISFHGEKKIVPSEIKDDTLIYTMDGKAFTYSDLKKRFPSEVFELNDQLHYMGELIVYNTLLHDDEFNKMVNTDYYKKVLQSHKTRALADTYMYIKHKENDPTNTKNPFDELEKNYKLNIISPKI